MRHYISDLKYLKKKNTQWSQIL